MYFHYSDVVGKDIKKLRKILKTALRKNSMETLGQIKQNSVTEPRNYKAAVSNQGLALAPEKCLEQNSC